MTNRELFSRLYRIIKPYWKRLAVAMVAMTAVAGLSAAQAYMVKPLLDEIFVNKNARLLNLLPLALLGIFLVKGIFYYTYFYLLEFVGQTIIRNIRQQIFAHINSLSLRFFAKTPTGELISRIISDVHLMQGAVSTALVGILRDLFQVVGLLSVIFYQDWRLATFSLIFLPLAFFPIVHFGRKFRRVSTDCQESLARVSSMLHETFTGQRIVKAFCTEQYENTRFGRLVQRVFEILMADTRYRSLSHPLMELLGGVGIALIIWFGGNQVLNGNSTPGTFFSFLTALIMVYEPIKGVSKINSTVQQGLAAAVRVFTLLDIEPDIRDRPDAVVLPLFHDAIELRQVTFGYTVETPVLHGIDLRVRRGEVLAVVGRSGGGKSTLVNLLPRFYEVDQGAISIDGRDIRDVTLDSLRRQIAVVTQQTILFNDTVRNNIAYGEDGRSEEEIRQAAQAAHALDFIERLPQGFDTVIGEGGSRLSGGERQRLSIARAIIKDSPILLLDEATSSLDTESERQVQQALDNLMQNRTTIIIAHRLSTIRNADRIIVLRDGRIVEEGSHEELLALHGEYEMLHAMQDIT